MSSSELIGEFPKRLKIFLIFALILFFSGYFSIVIIEDMTLVDAFYFLIVTISTVGFGDITPTSPYSKLVVSILIIVSISSIALLSEQIVSRLVEINTSRIYDIPTIPLAYQNHIIICGFTKIAENISLLFQARFFRIVVLDPHAVAVQRARAFGLEAYLARPELKSSLVSVNIEEAMALYLFMDDENKNVLTSLQARSIHEDLLIYASTEHELSIELGNMIGIDRTYHYERIVASNIRFSLQKINAFALPNQLLSDDAHLYQILVSKDYDYQNRFDEYYPVGILDRTLTEFKPITEVDDIDQELAKDNLLILSLPRAEIATQFDDPIMNNTIMVEAGDSVKTIIIGGYNDTAKHIIEELDPLVIENFEFKVLTFSPVDAAAAKKDGYETVLAQREELDHVFSSVDNSTLMVNLFDRLTDSLLINTVVRKLEKDIFIVQLAYNRLETDVLVKSGADRVLIPDMLMSRGMFLILLSTQNLINSMVWGNAHLFEHYVDQDSPLRGAKVDNLKSRGYSVLLYQSKSGKMRKVSDELTIALGSHVLLYRTHEMLRVTDQFIDKTQH